MCLLVFAFQELARFSLCPPLTPFPVDNGSVRGETVGFFMDLVVWRAVHALLLPPGCDAMGELNDAYFHCCL